MHLEMVLRAKARREGIGRLVVGAFIARAGTVLLLRRRPEDHFGGRWELPSGEVNPGESLRAGLEREVCEETGLIVRSLSTYLGSFDYRSSQGVPTRQFSFAVEADVWRPLVVSEHDAHAFLPPEAMAAVTMSEETRQVIARGFARCHREGGSRWISRP